MNLILQFWLRGGGAAGAGKVGRGARWRRPVRIKSLTPQHIQETPAFRRNKLTLLSMGVAIALVRTG